MATLERKMLYIKTLSEKTYRSMEEMYKILCKDDDIDITEVYEVFTSFIGSLSANYLENLKQNQLPELATECARVLLEDLSERYLELKRGVN